MKSLLLFFFPLLLLGCLAKTKKPISGVWRLHIIETQDSSGNWQQSNWMKNATGILHYDTENTVSVHFMPTSDTIPPYWYVAHYQYNADSSFVQHTRIMHSNPNEVGKTVKRYVNINGDTLTMNANEFGLQLKWIKEDE